MPPGPDSLVFHLPPPSMNTFQFEYPIYNPFLIFQLALTWQDHAESRPLGHGVSLQGKSLERKEERCIIQGVRRLSAWIQD